MTQHSKVHDLAGGDHNGVPQVSEDNLVAFDSTGLPKDSGHNSYSLPVFFDFRGNGAHTTGEAASGGGTVTGSIAVGVTAGIVFGLSVTANSNTVDSDIEFFADAARTKRIYFAENKDCFSSPHVDGTSWACFSFEADLEDEELYYQITNNGANNSTYDIELLGIGKQPIPVV